MNCPECGKALLPADHGDLVCDGQIWCSTCQRYDERLLAARPFPELATWAARLCRAFGQEPVQLRRDPDYLPNPARYWDGTTFVLAEAYHAPRCIFLHPPGHQLITLCHELAHLFTGQEHTETWARTCAALVAWAKARL